LRLSEIYTSIQGEGPNVGRPTQFVRFGGCNMRCPGWPCDTQHAIDPQYSDEWEQIEPIELMARVKDWPRAVCITGGEPLTQRTKEMDTFGDTLLDMNFDIDLFTNGSQAFPKWYRDEGVCIIMDWKLDGSGEGMTGIDQRVENMKLLEEKDAIKFVVKDRWDLEQAKDTYYLHNMYLRPFVVYIGAAWGHVTDGEIIEYLDRHQLNWMLNVQVHKYIWEPDKRGV